MQDLRAHRLWKCLHERQKPMRRRAGDDFQNALFLKAAERADEIALPSFDEVPVAIGKAREVKRGHFR